MHTVTTPDMIVSNRGRLVLAVQVKNLPVWTPADAEAYVGELFDGGASLGTRYLMLLSQESAFVWRVTPDPTPSLAALVRVEVGAIFDAYRHRAGITSRLYNEDLQMLAFDWLWRICDGTATLAELPVELSQVGLIDAMRDGTVDWRIGDR